MTTKHKLIALTLVAIAIRVTWAVVRYQDDPLLVDFGDYVLYEIGAQHWLAERDFSNSLFLVRPPLFALLIAGLGVNAMAVLVVNAVIGGLITPLTFGIARQLGLSEGRALLAAGIFAVDFVAVAYGSALLDSVPLGNIFAVLMVLLLLMIPQATRQRGVLLGLGAGLALVASMLARPEIYLIWTGLAVWLLVIARQQWRAVLSYVVVCVVGIGMWSAHNGIVFGNYTPSTISTFTMTFYRAASVERMGSGDEIDSVYMDITYRIEEKLGNDPTLATPDTYWGYLSASPAVQSALVSVSGEIFTEYPLIYLGTFAVGFVRMYALDPPFLRSTAEPGWMYVAVAWNWVLFLSAALGLLLAALQRRWRLFWCVFLVAGYYTAGTLLVKNAGMVGRERAVLTPYMSITAVVAWVWLWNANNV